MISLNANHVYDGCGLSRIVSRAEQWSFTTLGYTALKRTARGTRYRVSEWKTVPPIINDAVQDNYGNVVVIN